MRSLYLLLLPLVACVGDSTVGPNQDASTNDVTTSDAGNDVTADVVADVAPEASPCAPCDGGCYENVCNGADIVDVSGGGRHACALLASGSVWCWGANDDGQAGATVAPTLAPAKVAGLPKIARISAGINHTCAVDGSGDVYCWGANDQGQLGHDPSTDAKCGAIACDATPAKIASTDAFQSVSSGGNFTCAVDTVGAAYCWGDNHAGQLGIGSNNTTSGFTPTQVITLGPNVQSISAGMGTGLADPAGYHTCALKTDGTVWCWGADDYNQLGFTGSFVCADSNPCSPGPVQVTFPGSASVVVAGNAVTCAIMSSNGSVQCLGANYGAQLGNGTTGGPQTATLVSGLSKVIVALTAGGTGPCARAADGTTWCWGISSNGELGNGTTGLSSCLAGTQLCAPTPDTATGAYSHVSRGYKTVIAVKTDGTLWGWGSNSNGQLGPGDGGASTDTPVAISGVP